jgi:hypothetical protein
MNTDAIILARAFLSANLIQSKYVLGLQTNKHVIYGIVGQDQQPTHSAVITELRGYSAPIPVAG